MYIWILMATIMVAMAFYNVSPRVDKEHALNEIRAATVSNRFKIEHNAMLKTMECEILYQRNNGCWDAEWESGGCSVDTPRQSAKGPVDVSCFNPLAYNAEKCGSTNIKTISGDDGEIKMRTFPEDSAHDTVNEYNYFTKQVPVGYDTGKQIFMQGGIHHFIYCFDEVAERATNANFISCDMKGSASGDNTEETTEELIEEGGGEDPIGEGLGTEDPQTPSVHQTTEKKRSSRTRYLVTFAPIPEKWLSKVADDEGVKHPLPILVNSLAKNGKADTIFGWTICKPAVGDGTPSCRLYGINSRNANVRRKEDARTDNKGVSVDIKTYAQTDKVDEEGNLVYNEDGTVEQEKTLRTDHVLEYEKLPDNSVFWENSEFKRVCGNYPCMFAYERLPGTDTAFHCYNMMVGYNPEKIKKNEWKKKHGINETTETTETTEITEQEQEPIN